MQGFLAAAVDPKQCLALIEAAAEKRPCPHCGGSRCHRCGQANGLQRYRCIGCRHSFNALTGTPLARLRLRDKWLPNLQCLIESRTVRAAAERVAVAKSTSFRWRHRFIAAVRQERRPRLSGIAESDEGGVLACKRAPLRRQRAELAETPTSPYHLESQKGSRHLDRPARKRGGKATRRGISREFDCILVARDRNRHTCDFVTGRGPVTARQLATHLLPVLAHDVLLVSDSAKAYEVFAKQAGVTHEAVNVQAGIRARGAVHIQGVNGWHRRFKTWLRRFNGVASRYLANYTGWQRVLDAAALTAPAHWLRVAVAPG
ncbi:IS1595 family transposase [Massilia dura]|uniref:IS1595 family transposase n=1 Tax=Pseudoduganella dura TaxID=321982 RepID=A0A6I3X2D3_9BURK|nr:IS1595 family transposase [Pseudoduganella dura]